MPFLRLILYLHLIKCFNVNLVVKSDEFQYYLNDHVEMLMKRSDNVALITI